MYKFFPKGGLVIRILNFAVLAMISPFSMSSLLQVLVLQIPTLWEYNKMSMLNLVASLVKVCFSAWFPYINPYCTSSRKFIMFLRTSHFLFPFPFILLQFLRKRL